MATEPTQSVTGQELPDPLKAAEVQTNEQTLEALEAAAIKEVENLSQTKVEETPPQPASPAGETNQTTTDIPKVEGIATPTTTEVPEEVAKLSERAQKRYASMAEENRKLRDQLSRATQQRATLPPVPTPKSVGKSQLPWEADYNPSQDTGTREVSEEEYTAEVERRAREAVQKELAEQRSMDNLHSDVIAAQTEYSVLNPMHDDYDDALSTKIAGWYKGQTATQPDLRLKDFVDEVMGIYSKAGAVAKTQITGKVLQQAASQAIGSTPASATQGSVEDLLSKATSFADLERLEKFL